MNISSAGPRLDTRLRAPITPPIRQRVHESLFLYVVVPSIEGRVPHLKEGAGSFLTRELGDARGSILPRQGLFS
jgi:hypothetical protein